MKRRHPATVTAERLLSALDKWPDDFVAGDRDAIGRIIHALESIAERDVAMTATTATRFSAAQLTALGALSDARDGDDQSWIRANTLRSLRGLWWEQRGTKFLTSEGHAAFRAAGGHDAVEARGAWWSR